jgi:trk system potassium uptake protein TrkA
MEELPVIKGAHIAAIVRRGKETSVVQHGAFLIDEILDEVLIPHHDTVIETGDHVVVFCTRKQLVAHVEKLFQVSAGFF